MMQLIEMVQMFMTASAGLPYGDKATWGALAYACLYIQWVKLTNFRIALTAKVIKPIFQVTKSVIVAAFIGLTKISFSAKAEKV